MNASKFTRSLDPLNGDACGAKSFEVSHLIFSTDCSPVDWLQFVPKSTVLKMYFFFSSFLKTRRHVWERGNWFGKVHGQELLLERDF
jgi:hypothetical protein